MLMCGRFSLITIGQFLTDRFMVEAEQNMKPRYNIAPSQDIAIIRNDTPKKLSFARWGLVPHWAKDQSMAYKMINARAETVAEKPAYKIAFKRNRCLIPADGFYEWKKSDLKKVPYRIELKDKSLFAFAGMFDVWSHENIELVTCTIITTSPNKIVGALHDRMPVILARKNEQRWLEEHNESRLQEMLRPYPSDMMKAYTVSDQVNSPKNDSEEVARPVRSLLDY